MHISGVRDKVGPLEDTAGNITSQGFLMAEDLNGYFSSVFTRREDISSLPVPAMNDNKSPGVDGIPPKLLMETVEQISIPLVRVFNLPLKLKRGSGSF